MVTGPIFDDTTVVPDGRVRVPSATFTAIDDPKGEVVGAYVADNSADGRLEEISIAKLDAMIGLNLFPAFAPTADSQAPDLPSLN